MVGGTDDPVPPTTRRGRSPGGAAISQDARHPRRGEVRPHHTPGAAPFRSPDRAPDPCRCSSAVVQVAAGDRGTGDASRVFLLRPRHPRSIERSSGPTERDRLVALVAHALLRALRSSDLVSRVGADTFAALMSDTTIQAAGVVAERLSAELAQSAPTPPSVSMGKASFDPRSPSALGDLLDEATRSLSRVRAGREP